MKRAQTAMLALTIVLSACYSRKVHPSEAWFLPDSLHPTYYLCDAVSSDGSVHRSALLVESPAEQGTSTSLFLSEWRSDSSFHYGMKSFQMPLSHPPQRWPLQFSSGDSSGLWRWRFDRSSLWIDGQESGSRHEPIRWRGRLERPNTLYHATLANGEGAEAVAPLAMRWKGDGIAMLNIARLDKQITLPTQPGEVLVWLSLHSEADLPVRMLLRRNVDGRWNCAGVKGPSPQNGEFVYQYISPTSDAMETWQSPHSHKRYPFLMQIGWGDGIWFIAPRGVDQELKAGKRSFWMGAVSADLTDPFVPTRSYFGNMYIFIP